MNKTKINRVGEENTNHQGCLMKIIEYNRAQDIIVEFQDEHKARVHTQYHKFSDGGVKNPYYPEVYGVGIVGNKYPTRETRERMVKEYTLWCKMLSRCYDDKEKQKRPTYNGVTCCEEWLLYENFYEWLHSQENFDKWKNGNRWCLDKDILVKGNKIYSPETCCLVSNNVNVLFTKSDKNRGRFPIGVCKHENKFAVYCNNPFTKEQDYLGSYHTKNEAFIVYKNHKENKIKQVAEEEYNLGNIIKKCYEAMMKYEVEIDD